MTRQIAILGAPTALGIRPYADGGVRRLDLAPKEFRRLGLAGMLGARDDGDIPAPPYVDLEHGPGKARNERLVADYSYALASRVNSSGARGEFVLVLGGDCRIVLGNMLGVTRRVRNEVPALFLGHGDVMGEREALGWGNEVLYDPDVHGGLGEQLRSEEHTSELQSRANRVCRLLL